MSYSEADNNNERIEAMAFSHIGFTPAFMAGHRYDESKMKLGALPLQTGGRWAIATSTRWWYSFSAR